MNYNTATAWSFGKQTKTIQLTDKDTISTPGPGNYKDDININKKSIFNGYSFGKNPKIVSIKNTTPGPGYYSKKTDNVFGQDTPKFTLGKSDRSKEFNLNSSIGSTSITPIVTKAWSNPGPGHYSIDISNVEKTKKKSPSYKIGTSTKEIKYDNSIPGPGQYENNKQNIQKNTPKWSLSKSQREDHLLKHKSNINIVPGPGMYTISEPGKAAKISIRGKEMYSPKNNNPGPASYFHDDTSNNLKKGPGWRLGTSKRDDNFVSKVTLSTPGPGMYNSNPLVSTQSKGGFKFGTDPKMKNSKSTNPGPGHYYIPCSMVNVPKYTTGKFEQNYKYV